jgi:beta-fructofuranosidase
VDLCHRPRYHFTSPANFMNDPSGLLRWKGRYHLLYQHNPHGAVSRDKHKGHAVSEDLVHWVHLPIALAPSPGGPDEAHCATGCLVDDGGTPTLVYSAFASLEPLVESVCLARSDDDLLTWRKHAGNPVLAGPPEGLEVEGWRDPCVWREGGGWRMLLGSGLRGLGGAALLYRSPDLEHWEYVGPLLLGEGRESGRMWECPNLFPLGGRHVLTVSSLPGRRALYFAGTYDGRHFLPEAKGTLDWGGCLYAPQTVEDAQGRRILLGWLQEARTPQAQAAAGWSGVMSLPQVLSLGAGGALAAEPTPEVERLRGARHRYTGVELGEGVWALPEVQGEALEVVATVEVGEASQVGLALARSPGGEEETLVVYDRARGRLRLDRRRSSRGEGVALDVCVAPLALAPGEPLRLRVFLDGSVVEVYANGGLYMAGRIYPTREDSLGVGVYARGGGRLAALDVWEMESIWRPFVA